MDEALSARMGRFGTSNATVLSNKVKNSTFGGIAIQLISSPI